MHELWSSASYDAHLLSLPFAFAPAAMAVVIAYGIVMRGEPVLRAWMLLHFVSLMPYSIVMMLMPSVTNPDAAEALLRVAAAFIPMAAAAGLGFQLRLVGVRTFWVWGGVAIAVGWVIAGALTNAAVDGVYRLPAGLWYANHGPYAWLALASTIAFATPGFALLLRASITRPPSHERRQLRSLLLANIVTYLGLFDVLLAWHVGVFPLGWLLSGLGSVFVVRALVFEDLLRVRAVDDTAPRVLLHLAVAALLGWISLALLGNQLAWWGAVLVMLVVFAAARVTIAIFSLISRGARAAEGPLDRLLNQLVTRSRTARDEAEVARLAIDIIELGVGMKVTVLVASTEDYGWRDARGTRLADDVAPDPLLGAWLAENPGAVFGEAARVPDDLRPLLKAVLDRAQASTLIPVANHDELLGVVMLPAMTRRQRRRMLGFVERASERLGEGVLHARMAQAAADRATLAREVELAATVQRTLLPPARTHTHHDFTIIGSWFPATRCAGDFWGYYPLGDDRMLIAIGDVTGHGVASATVTAGAAAACDVAVRRHGEALTLADVVTAVERAVVRVGGGELSMTLFAAILDGKAEAISYVSCGHPAPYVCHRSTAGIELQALVARGNPLGAGSVRPKIAQRALRAGDLLVWYTDGVIEAQDPKGEPFGDRRLQRLLKKLDALVPANVHDLVHASVAAHRAGRPRNDDETLVVAQWRQS
ncbi:MAG: SpoIIE family protein phosphatase [Kofleriaceae bacterium]